MTIHTYIHTSYVFSFPMVFEEKSEHAYLVTTGWIFDVGLCANSISNQMITNRVIRIQQTVLLA